MAYQITTQRELRRAFWRYHPNASKKRNAEGNYLTDTRVSFVDFIDHMSREGTISQELAQRATLDG